MHDPALMRRIEDEDIALVTSLGRGRTLMTIAPERTTPETIRRLADAGVILAAGHTAASYEDMGAASDAGLTGVTHLFNAMPPLAGPRPGRGGRGARRSRPLAQPDRRSLPCLGAEPPDRPRRPRLGADDAGQRRDVDRRHRSPNFTLGGRVITRANGRLTTADGTIAGSDLDMATAVRNTVEVARPPDRGGAAHGLARPGRVPRPRARARTDRAGLPRQPRAARRCAPGHGDLDRWTSPRRKP